MTNTQILISVINNFDTGCVEAALEDTNLLPAIEAAIIKQAYWKRFERSGNVEFACSSAKAQADRLIARI